MSVTNHFQIFHGLENFYSPEYIENLYQTEFQNRGITAPYPQATFINMCNSIIQTKNYDAFRRVLMHLMDDAAIEEFFLSDDGAELLQLGVSRFRTKLTEKIMIRFTIDEKYIIIFSEFVPHPDNKLMELILDADFCVISINILECLHKTFDMKNYLKQIASLFTAYCLYLGVDQIKRFINMGYDIRELYNAGNKTFNFNALYNSLKNNDREVFKFLLQQGVDFRQYEAEFLRNVIYNLDVERLKLFLEHGANIDILQNDNREDKQTLIEIFNLLNTKLDVTQILLLLR